GMPCPFAGQTTLVDDEVDVEFVGLRAMIAHRVGGATNGVLATVGIGPAALLVDMGQMQPTGLLIGKEKPQIFVRNAGARKILEPVAAKSEPQHAGRQKLAGKHSRFEKNPAHALALGVASPPNWAE